MDGSKDKEMISPTCRVECVLVILAFFWRFAYLMGRRGRDGGGGGGGGRWMGAKYSTCLLNKNYPIFRKVDVKTTYTAMY